MRKKRVQHVDVAKGVSIVLVALNHSTLIHYYGLGISESLGLIRMPLFFFLSGVFFSDRASFASFFNKKFEALLKPYFMVLLTALLLGGLLVYLEIMTKSAIVDYGLLPTSFVDILYGAGATLDHKFLPMWFLPHLFLVFSASYLLLSVFRFIGLNSVFTIFFFVSALFVVGVGHIDFFYTQNFNVFGRNTDSVGLPFSLDILPVTMFYFIVGYTLANRIIVLEFSSLFGLVFLTLFLVIAVFFSPHIDLSGRQFEKPILALIASFAGIYITIQFSLLLGEETVLANVFKKLGEASLFVLIFHFLIHGFVKGALMKLAGFEEEGIGVVWVYILAFLASIMVPLALKAIAEKCAVIGLVFFPVKNNSLYRKYKHTVR